MPKKPLKPHETDALIYSQYHENHVLIGLQKPIETDKILDLLYVFFNKLIQDGNRQIVFDMGNISYPGGKLIALLIGITVELRRQDGDLHIINLRDQARNDFSYFTPLTFLSIATEAVLETGKSESPEEKTVNAEDGFDETADIPRRIRVNATVDAVQDVTDFVVAWAKRTNIETLPLSKLKIAVHEACMNVIEHGYQFAQGKELEIEVHLDALSFQVLISDWGTPFEKFGRRDYNVEEAFEKQQRGGYGFYIMQQSVDELRYEFGEDGNRLTLILEYESLEKEAAKKNKG